MLITAMFALLLLVTGQGTHITAHCKLSAHQLQVVHGDTFCHTWHACLHMCRNAASLGDWHSLCTCKLNLLVLTNVQRWYTCKQQHPASTLLSTFQSMVNGDCGLGLQFIMCHKGRQAQVPCFMLYAQQEQGVETPASLYYEPHCDFDAKSLQGLGPVDVVVSPVQGVLLGG
eukprot:GHRR01018365.1.p1 GENE.GHRR01018365.1~~GHRR01018365.1.p1  ORF type:complete len:172 (+),score=32.94 GHRR01018365.1:1372-1887(+)